MRKVISLVLVLVMVSGVIISSPVMASAGVYVISESGSFSDTSRPDGGTIYWQLSGNLLEGEASLKITGNGYMPNDMYDQSWHSKLPLGCFLTSVTIGEGVKSIMNDAFYGEIFLESIKLPESLEIIGENAFGYTGITVVDIPKNVRTISSTQFESSIMLYYNVSEENPYYKSIDGVVYSKDGTELVAFPCGRYFESDYTFLLPEEVTTIGRYAFYNSAMKSFVVPDNVKEIKSLAFMGATELEYLYLGKNVHTIYDSAFLACNDLKEVFIPPTVSYIGYNALGYDYVIYYDGIAEVLDQAGIEHGRLESYEIPALEELLMEIDYSVTNFAGPEKRDDFKICAPKSSSGEAYANRFGFKFVESNLCETAFTGINVLHNGIVLDWAEAYGADRYIVERKNSVGSWVALATIDDAYTTTYTDEMPYTTTINTYRIRSINTDGNKVMFSKPVSADYLDAPVLNSAKNDIDGIIVSWSGVQGADTYNVYRKKVGEETFRFACTVDASKKSYMDTDVENGEEYIYTVSAFSGKKVSKYDPVGVKCEFLSAPVCTVSNGEKGVVVKWSKNDAADSYSIYRKIGSGSSVLVGTATADATSFIDEGVKSGTTYKYYVKASSNGVKSACLTKSNQTIKYLKAPLSVKLENKTNGVKVSWSKISGASGYYVYRRTPGGSFKRIATIKKGSTVSFTDKKVSNGKKYEYTVKAYSGSYTSYYVKNGVLDKYLSAPKLSSVSSSKKGVTVKFKAVSGSEGYYIYRRSVNGSWSNIAKVKNGKATAYTDKTAKKGKTYIYTVRAYNGSFRSGFYSGLKIKDKY